MPHLLSLVCSHLSLSQISGQFTKDVNANMFLKERDFWRCMRKMWDQDQVLCGYDHKNVVKSVVSSIVENCTIFMIWKIISTCTCVHLFVSN